MAVVYIDPRSGLSPTQSINFLPERGGRVRVAYVTGIQPFLRYLEVVQTANPHDPPTQTSLVFDPLSDVSTSVIQLNHVIEKISASHSSVSLKLDSWREIAVSINLDLANKYGLMSNNPNQRDDDSVYVPTLSPVVLHASIGSYVTVSREAAERYHQALGFGDGVGTSPITMPSTASS